MSHCVARCVAGRRAQILCPGSWIASFEEKFKRRMNTDNSAWLQTFQREILTPDLSRCQRSRAHYCSATHTDPGHLNSTRRKNVVHQVAETSVAVAELWRDDVGHFSLCKNPAESLWCFSKNMGGLKSWSRMNSSSLLNAIRAELCPGSQSKTLGVLTDSMKHLSSLLFISSD